MAPATISLVVRRTILLCVTLPWAVPLACSAQETISGQPQVKLLVLNVCALSVEEQQESTALDQISKDPGFRQDSDVERRRVVLDLRANPLTVLEEQRPQSSVVADFVRFLQLSELHSAFQYSFSRDGSDAKDPLQAAIEPSASSVTTVAAMLDAMTPARSIKRQRFEKSPVGLARRGAGKGQAPEQIACEPVFRCASSILMNYRNLLGKTLRPEELLNRSAASLSGGLAQKPKNPEPKNPEFQGIS